MNKSILEAKTITRVERPINATWFKFQLEPGKTAKLTITVDDEIVGEADYIAASEQTLTAEKRTCEGVYINITTQAEGSTESPINKK